jgi:hypothetical protein
VRDELLVGSFKDEAVVAQVPAIVQAAIASDALQAELTKIKMQAVAGGIVLGALIVWGVHLTRK